jgi:antirestriction protein
MTTTTKTDAQIYVACLASYNSGVLHGEWITPKADKEELQEQINEVLKSSPIPNAEEWAIHDYDEFPNLGEYPGIENIIKVQEAIEEHSIETVVGFLEHWSIGDLESIGDAYYGEYQNFSEFAQQLAEDTIEGLSGESALARYFNWEAFERDLGYDFHEASGAGGTSIIFNSNW